MKHRMPVRTLLSVRHRVATEFTGKFILDQIQFVYTHTHTSYELVISKFVPHNPLPLIWGQLGFQARDIQTPHPGI